MTVENKHQVFLVEDDQFLSSLLKNRFEKEGFEVLLARTGDEAIEILKTAEPDLVMLDIILPGMSGFEVLERIRANVATSKTPVIVISNLGQDEDIERAKQLGGIVDYFVKARTPIDDLVARAKAVVTA
jgi:DNA-binding response OmpR family regulator